MKSFAHKPEVTRGLHVVPSAHRLTPREQQVLELAWMPNAEIARILGTSPRTVQCQMAAVLLKLGAENRTQATLLYYRDLRTAA